MNVDMLFYMIGAFSIAGITTFLFMWAILTKQYKEDEKLRMKPLEDD